MSKAGRKKPSGGPAPCRGIDYSNLITGPRLTDKRIEQYMLDGYYGEEVRQQAIRRKKLRQRKSKTKSTSTRPTCASILTRLQKFIGSPNERSENTNR